MRRSIPWLAMLLLGAGTAGAAAPEAALRVKSLADRYVAEVRGKYPLSYTTAGLPDPRRDILDINSARDLRAWRKTLGGFEREAAAIDEAAIRGQPEWITLAQLRQALRQERAFETCHLEWWSVRTFGWQAFLPQVAELQPVGDVAARADILARFGGLPRYVDAEIANLREGLRRGYSSPRRVVEAVLESLDALLGKPLTDGAFASPADRDGDAAFGRRWATLLEAKVRPAYVRYRDFLRKEYLPKARANPGITALPNGRECYRALAAAQSSVDVDSAALFERARVRADAEATLALDAGKRRYGRDFATLAALAAAMSEDVGNRFQDETQLREFIVASIRRGREGAARVVPQVPAVDVEARPFPAASGPSMPSGQYIPRDQEGRPPLYYYRSDFGNLSPARLEATVLHEAWPGHHLQMEVTRARSESGAHPLAQLVYVPGVGEGWATYVEGLARELSLYESELGVMGSVLDSMTPRLVADIGMHVMGWSEEQALAYLVERFPATPVERVKQTVTTITSEPGIMVPYALGAMEIESMREELRELQGERFDLRAFHQQIIEDGTVPFPELRVKLRLAPW